MNGEIIINATILKILSSVSGHRQEDLNPDMYLESDLGFDSIKMISLMNELMKIVPPEQLPGFTEKFPVESLLSIQTVMDLNVIFEEWQSFSSGKNAAEEKPSDDLNSSLKIKNDVFQSISNITGHRIEDLEPGMFLESDLGIDSIKMISLMNELMKLIPPGDLGNFTARFPVSELMSLQTAGDIIHVFEKWADLDPSFRQEAEPEKLEILNSQYLFLISYMSVSTVSICSGIKLAGTIDTGCLWNSWKTLISRHPVLMTAFKTAPDARTFGDFSLEIIKDGILPPVGKIDISHLDRASQNIYIREKIEEELNKKFALSLWPLHHISVIQTGENESEILLSISHIISDGLGNQLFLKELLEIYGSEMRGSAPVLPVPLSPAGYNKIAGEMNGWNTPEENKNLENYLAVQGKNKYVFNPDDIKKAAVREPFQGIITRVRKYWVEKEVLVRLNGQIKTRHVSLFVLLTAAYLRTVLRMGEREKNIVINLPTSGQVYPNIDATGVMSSFAQNMALTLSMEEAGRDWEELIGYVHSEIKTGITSGIDRAQTYQAATRAKVQEILNDGVMSQTTASFIRSSLKSNLYLSFVGNTNIRNDYNGLEVVDYEAYTCTNPATLDNLVEIFHDKLLITSNYDSSFFDGLFVDKFIDCFKGNLEEISCLATEKSGIKPAGPVYRSDHSFAEGEFAKAIEEVCGRAVSPAVMDLELEAEFGMDSLERIRVIVRLAKTFKTADKDRLFECSTLKGMLDVLNDKNPGGYKDSNGIEMPYLKIIEQCKASPDAAAIIFRDEIVTYGELDILSNRVANYLISAGFKRGSLAGIMTLPGPLMLTGMLGILKTGAAYVPVDPNYPPDRIRYILNQAGIQILLTEQALKLQVEDVLGDNPSLQSILYLDEGQPVPGVSLKQVMKESWMERPPLYVKCESEPGDLMLVLYTSGSTGNPKGVMLAHNGYMNRLVWHQKQFALKPGMRVAQKTSCCFDISVWELFWPLMYGGTVCPVGLDIVRNPWKLARWLIDRRINIMHFVPSLFREFVNAIESEQFSFDELRWLIFSGEVLPMNLVQKWIDRYGLKTGLANLYGPTEASIDVTCHIIDKRPGSAGEKSIPIGKEIDNVYIKILGDNMEEMHDGETGELWIGGIQLAKGYLNNSRKTSEAFKANPFPDIPGGYLYRSGDLAVKNPGGSIDYHGRIDNQVKIRGFRIELGEIESVLSAYPGVDEAAVTVIDDSEGQKRLIAWLSGKKTQDKEIKGSVSKKLPDYMVPHRIEWLDKLPKNPNGKLDRNALNSINSSSNEFPLAPAQSWLMGYFEKPYLWAGYTRFFYKQPLDFQLFVKALDILIKNHDVLRCVLVQRGTEWVQKIVPVDPKAAIEFYETVNSDPERRNLEIKDLISKNIGDLRVDRWPLWKVFVVKVSYDFFDISVVGHHLIADLISNSILFQEIWFIYGQLLSGEKDLKWNSRASFRDFISLACQKKEENSAAYVRYWTENFDPVKKHFHIPADHNAGPNNEDSAGFEKLALSAAETSVILGKAKSFFNSKVYPIIIAPLYQILGNLYNRESVTISHRVHGRDPAAGFNFFRTPGNFAVNFPLNIVTGSGGGWKAAVSEIKNRLESVPLNGISYDLVSGELPPEIYPDNKLTSVRVNYLGNRDLPNYSVFEFPGEDTDKRFSLSGQKRMSIIEFFFSIEEGKLKIDIEYSKNSYYPATIKMIGNYYIGAVQELVSFVLSGSAENAMQSLIL